MATSASESATALGQFARHETLSASSGTLRLASTVSSTFEVTTLDDVVDASDGLLSLREAVTLANDQAGADIITFADSLRGGTIRLELAETTSGNPGGLGDLVITDDVVIDGDSANGGPGGITIHGAQDPDGNDFIGAADVIRVEGAQARLEDLTLAGGDTGLRGNDADVQLYNSAVQDNRTGIDFDGGTLSITDSGIVDNIVENEGGYKLGGGVVFSGENLTIERSLIAGNYGGPPSSNTLRSGSGIIANGEVVIRDSTVHENGWGDYGYGMIVHGHLSVEGSAITANGAVHSEGGGVVIYGTFDIANSTIAGNHGGYNEGYAAPPVGGLVLMDDSVGSITNTTISGSSYSIQASEGATDNGIVLGENVVLTINNSIIDDGIVGSGSIISNGANTFRDAVVDGAVAGDRLGVTADQLFAVTEELPFGVLRGVPLDNGGPTQTIALLNSADNPAIDAADPADAPATDQRGIARDATPDIGAFEAASSPPPDTLPDLIEGSPLATSLVNGVDPRMLTIGDTGDAIISFITENGAFDSNLYAYLVDDQGYMSDVANVFRTMNADMFHGSFTIPGESVALSEIFDPGDLAEGTQFGLFLLADGANTLDGYVGDRFLAFLDGDDPATIYDTAPALMSVGPDGQERIPIEGEVMHALDADPSDPLANDLNADGRGHVVSGWLDGRFVVGFEDKPWPSGDSQEPDFNDVLIAISPASPGGANGSASALSAGIIDETGPEQAELDAALGSLSSSAVADSGGPGGMSAMAGGAADTEQLVIAGDIAA